MQGLACCAIRCGNRKPEPRSAGVFGKMAIGGAAACPGMTFPVGQTRDLLRVILHPTHLTLRSLFVERIARRLETCTCFGWRGGCRTGHDRLCFFPSCSGSGRSGTQASPPLKSNRPHCRRPGRRTHRAPSRIKGSAQRFVRRGSPAARRYAPAPASSRNSQL